MTPRDRCRTPRRFPGRSRRTDQFGARERAHRYDGRVTTITTEPTTLDRLAADYWAEAREHQGSAFEIRRFHDVVLGEGALPLPAMRQVVERSLA